ncbi:MAG: sugar phosphate isomerase/epimerase family protein [Bacillota bacterium]
MASFKYGSGSWVFGSQRDRFVDYRPTRPLTEKIRLLGQIPGIQGVEIIHPYDEIDIKSVKQALSDSGLSVVSVLASGINDFVFRYGGLSSSDKKLRLRALDSVRDACDVARALGAGVVTLWCGQDGYDYPFQTDYASARGRLAESIGAAASWAPDLMFALEYKPREPRVFCFIDRLSTALLLAHDTGCQNVGVALDFGHSLMAGENPADAAQCALARGKLFLVHMNDNFGTWDDDLVPVTVHFWQTVEFFYVLQAERYEGFVSLDMAPFRESPEDAVRTALRLMEHALRVAEGVDSERLDALASFEQLLNAQSR